MPSKVEVVSSMVGVCTKHGRDVYLAWQGCVPSKVEVVPSMVGVCT